MRVAIIMNVMATTAMPEIICRIIIIVTSPD
jgi:hypothetical protein